MITVHVEHKGSTKSVQDTVQRRMTMKHKRVFKEVLTVKDKKKYEGYGVCQCGQTIKGEF